MNFTEHISNSKADWIPHPLIDKSCTPLVFGSLYQCMVVDIYESVTGVKMGILDELH